MKKIVLSVFLCATIITFAQDKKAYQIFDKNGKKTSYEKLLKAGEKADVVLFGEYHDNSVVHWLQLEFTKDLAEKKALVLGAEMLEADNSNASESIFEWRNQSKTIGFNRAPLEKL